MSVDKPIAAGVADRYARALFELAHTNGSLDQVAGDLASLRTLMANTPDLARFVRSPLYKADEQLRAMNKIFDKTGFSPVTRNFMGVVIQHRRLFALPVMLRAFGKRLARHRGEMSAEVVSAHPLSDTQIRTLEEALSASTGNQVRINRSVDTQLLGGATVKMGSRMIDASLRTKLNTLTLAMKEAG